MATRILFGSFGLLVLLGVCWAIKIGGYPTSDGQITRLKNPVTFWLVMSLTAFCGGTFLLLAAAA